MSNSVIIEMQIYKSCNFKILYLYKFVFKQTPFLVN